MKPYVEILDASKLDLDKLRPYLPQEALLKALRAWARITEHKQPMAGAIIEMRADTVYRG